MHALANPARFLSFARPLTPWLGWGGAALLGASLLGGLLLSPRDYLQGETVRIMYVHVPTAWLGMGGWAALAAASASHLIWRHTLAGIAARAIAVPGAVMTALALATGAIWGRPTWGTWWEWDGRLTSMLLLFFLYCGYLALNAAERERGGEAKLSAIFGLVGAVNLPVIHFSVIWWNTLHQPPSLTTRGSAIDASMLWPLLGSTLGFTLLFAAVVLMRMRAILGAARFAARLRRAAA